MNTVSIGSLYNLGDHHHFTDIIKGQYKKNTHYPATLEVNSQGPIRLCLYRVQNNKRWMCNRHLVIKDHVIMGARNFYSNTGAVLGIEVSSGSTKFTFSENPSSTELYEIVAYAQELAMTPFGIMSRYVEIYNYFFTFATGNSVRENISKQFDIIAPHVENPHQDVMEEEFTIDLTI